MAKLWDLRSEGERLVRVQWVSPEFSGFQNGSGYARARQQYHDALLAGGFTIDDGADLAVHWTPPQYYSPTPGKRNVLGTGWNSISIMPEVVAALNAQDTVAVFTPSEFCRKLFEPVTQYPVYVCPHGFDERVFRYEERRWSRLDMHRPPFTYLYVGANNPAKGVNILLDWWTQTELGRVQYVALYLKMPGSESLEAQRRLIGGGMRPLIADGNGGAVWVIGNICLDTRWSSQEDLARLYRAAHCFVLPSHGDSFALTLIEAMATGLPAVCTRWGGYLDYCTDETAYLVKCKREPLAGSDNRTYIGAVVNAQDWCDQTSSVINNYERAVEVGRCAAEHVRTKWTLRKMRRAFVATLEEIDRQTSRHAA